MKLPIKREEIYAAIDGERAYQDFYSLREPDGLPPFSSGDYIVMLQHYANALTAAWATEPGAAPEAVLANMRKVAAIAVQCMEWHGVVTRKKEGLGQWGVTSIKALDAPSN